MLIAADLPLPQRIHAHGWVTLGGQKLSKTRGVFIDPMSLVGRFGSDAVRWVLMAEIPFDRDGDFSLESFIDRYNADLANDYGNLVSRTEKMVRRYFAQRVPEPGPREPIDEELSALSQEVVEHHDEAMDRLDISAAIAAAMRLVARANKYIEEVAPWQLHRESDARLATVCNELLESIRVSTLLLHPVIPQATSAVALDLGLSLQGNVGDAARTWGALAPGSPIEVGDILFPRLDREEMLEAGNGQLPG
jgi:methionyl-tRNA synthetase